jgi:hypothetical protein
MIDIETGSLRLSNDLVISYNYSLDSLKKYELGETHEETIFGNGWARYWIRNLKIGNSYYFLNFGFYNGKFKEVVFKIDDKRHDLKDLGHRWDDWDEREERNLAVKYNSWLDKTIGKERKFNWGEIWSEYDPKGGSSSIGLRYYDKIND